ncbi:uncharacterized protein LOC135348482 [Halichondria panicea]|uniref:uncharacterized protein LOC135348482 n=1 Tax=Halichondria panicea TaxID=6063 RepID=UPI00312B5AEC
MSSVLLIFCCLLGLGSAWNQPSTCYIRSQCSSETETQLTKISESLLSELKHIREALETIADKLLDAEGNASAPVSTTSMPTAATSTMEATTSTTSEPTAMITDPPTTSDICGGPGWTRVAYINMTDPNQQCPQGLQLTDYSIRSCGLPLTTIDGGVCESVMFPVSGVQYRKVCGRAIGYRWGFNNAFVGYHTAGRNTIDVAYVDGLSVTHGQSPRTHIWTFASGRFNGTSGDGFSDLRCPCDEGNTYGSPPFVGNDYFCDSVVNDVHGGYRFYPDNALWDGQSSLNTCFNNNNPPWFTKTLSTPTTDDIELRMCFNNNGGTTNMGLQLMEIYIS